MVQPRAGPARARGGEGALPAAHAKAEARLLVDGMLDEHRVITGLVGEISAAADLARAAAAGHALRVMFAAHLAKENELILPLLAAAPDVALADLLAGMHELLGGCRRQRSRRALGRGRPRLRLRRGRRSRATRSSTPGPSRTPSGTPRSSERWTPCARVAGWC